MRKWEKRDSWPSARGFGSVGLPLCNNQHLYFLCSDALTSGVLLTPEGPLCAGQFLETVNNVPLSMSFKCGPLKPAPTPQSPYLSSFHTLGHHPSALIIPGSDTRQLGTVPMSQSLLNLFKLANPKSVYLPLLFLPAETTRKDLFPLPVS